MPSAAPTACSERFPQVARNASANRVAETEAAKPRAKKPAAVTPGCPPLKASRAADAPPPPKPIGAPTGTELVTTTIRAAGELAQIGFVVGGQMLKRTIDRIPRAVASR